jgi:hypothetical protein
MPFIRAIISRGLEVFIAAFVGEPGIELSAVYYFEKDFEEERSILLVLLPVQGNFQHKVLNRISSNKTQLEFLEFDKRFNTRHLEISPERVPVAAWRTMERIRCIVTVQERTPKKLASASIASTIIFT